MIEITGELAGLREQISALVAASGSSLTTIYGIGPFVAARILAEVVNIARYPSRHHFAAANGSAPIPASSGRTVRNRLNRGGNRQLNRALYTITITEIRADTEGRTYATRRRQDQPRSTALPQTTALRRRLQDPARRRHRDGSATGHRRLSGRLRPAGAVDVRSATGHDERPKASCAAGLAVPILLFAQARHPRPPQP
jgi:transposase